VSKQRVAVALRPGLVAAVVFSLMLPQLSAAAPPSASFSYLPEAPLTNEQVTFVSTSSGPVSSQAWDLDGDRVCGDASGPSAQRSFPTAGVYRITLCVSGGTGSSSVTDNITVQNRPPFAAFTHAPSDPFGGDSVMLTSISADPDGPIVSQAWDLDADGAFDDGEGPTASVSFAAPGNHPVGLLVTDRDGAATATAVAIPVHKRPPDAINPFPVVRIVGSFGEQGIKIEQLVVTAPDGARVEIGCRGHGCPFKRLIRKAQPQTVRVRRFAHRVLRPGAIVQVWVTRPGEIGKYTRLRIRKGKRPTRVDRCLSPGSKKPKPCLS